MGGSVGLKLLIGGLLQLIEHYDANGKKK